MRLLRTIGYEGSSIENFLATLVEAGVDQIIDVRELPLSRKAGFSKTALRSHLADARIDYLHLRGLGDPKPGRIAAREGRIADFVKIYRAHMSSDRATLDLATATEAVSCNSACLMCFEADHTHCHRSIVAEAISRRANLQIEHLRISNPAIFSSTKGFRNGGRSSIAIR